MAAVSVPVSMGVVVIVVDETVDECLAQLGLPLISSFSAFLSHLFTISLSQCLFIIFMQLDFPDAILSLEPLSETFLDFISEDKPPASDDDFEIFYFRLLDFLLSFGKNLFPNESHHGLKFLFDLG